MVFVHISQCSSLYEESVLPLQVVLLFYWYSPHNLSLMMCYVVEHLIMISKPAGNHNLQFVAMIGNDWCIVDC